VSPLTTAASSIDRVKDAGMFAIIPGLNTSRNQENEMPTIGKVTPPLGPWNDST
jgi:hypothetical protein